MQYCLFTLRKPRSSLTISGKQGFLGVDKLSIDGAAVFGEATPT